MENKILTTVSDDYDGIFKGFPIRLYQMFRFQSELGFEIPNKQLEYAGIMHGLQILSRGKELK